MTAVAFRVNLSTLKNLNIQNTDYLKCKENSSSNNQNVI